MLRTVDLDDAPEDPRKMRDNKPWRKHQTLSFLSTGLGNESRIVDILYETQHSFTVYGPNKSVWTSNYLCDTYFYKVDSENQDTVDYYTEEVDDNDDYYEECQEKWDPSTIGIVEAEKVSHPCDYFLMVLHERFKQCHEEWVNTFITIEKRISNHVRDTTRILHPGATKSS